MEPVECDRFVVALHYVYGSALMGRQEAVVSHHRHGIQHMKTRLLVVLITRVC